MSKSLDAALRRFTAPSQLQEISAQLSKPLGGSMERLFPATRLAQQFKDFYATDMSSRFGVTGVAEGGLASQVGAIQVAARVAESRLMDIPQRQGMRAVTESARIRPLAWRSPLTGGIASDAITRITDQLVNISAHTSLHRPGLSELLVAPRTIGVTSLVSPSAVTEAFEKARPFYAAVEKVAKRWEQSALWFMLSSLSIGHLLRFAEMDSAEIEFVLLGALETIVTHDEYPQALRSALDKAPHISTVQRGHLQHGLEHAEGGEFEQAIPPLMYGMEGALWSTARALSLIDAKRRLVNKPRRPRARSIEPVIKELPAGDGFSTFVIHRVFGGSGNTVRHGEPGFDGRHRALFLVVAVAGWLDAVMDVPAHEVLGHMLGDALRQ
jgi:hypothetical protein